MSKNFVLIGPAGYIAPRHLRAIKETGNNLIAVVDKSDSVGILDSYFENVDYFSEFERFDRHISKLLHQDKQMKIDYVTICTPNYLHDAHIRFALRIGAIPICEKPLVLNPWNLDLLEELEKDSGNKIYTILQLREHNSLKKLKKQIGDQGKKEKYDIILTYITHRGNWYHYSWKGNMSKSGGLATNIGIHFFDMLMWIFGESIYQEVHYSDENKISGYLELEKAKVKWFLSIDKNDLPENMKKDGKRTYRSILIDNKEIEFSKGFTDLHTAVYKNILDGKGPGIAQARRSINLVYELRNSKIFSKNKSKLHPFLTKT